jgi:hypothetical protein
MPGEFTVYGVFVPTLLALMTLAYLLKGGVRLVLQRLGAYHHIWHPSLFNFAVFLVLLDGLYRLLHWISP